MSKADTMTREAPRATGSAARLLRVLEAVVDADGPVTVRALARSLAMSPSTTHRLLNTLRGEGYLRYLEDRQAYGVGPELHRVAARVASQLGPVALARDVAQEAAEEFDETILFGLHLPHLAAMSFEVRADGQKKLMYHIEMHRPASLVWGASGRAILAHLSEADFARAYAAEGPSPARGERLPGRRTLKQDLETVREQGFAISHGQKLPDARGIAAPVFGPDGVVGSLCLTSPRQRLADRDAAKIARRIAEHAARLSHQLGAPG
ncbi:MAG: IclR family transcriptional regulator [Planctomycetota bacterium]